MNLDLIVDTINHLVSKVANESEIINYLKSDSCKLTDGDKSVVYSYLRKPIIIGDYELPSLLFGVTDESQRLSILVDAWKSKQYHRFMIHMLISFIQYGSTMHYASDLGNNEAIGKCGITGKTIYSKAEWDKLISEALKNSPDNQVAKKEYEEKESIAITNSSRTDTIICKQALNDLVNLYNFLEKVDPDFLKNC